MSTLHLATDQLDVLTLDLNTNYLHLGSVMTPHTGTSERTHLATSDLHLPQRRPHLDIPQTVQDQQEPLDSGKTPSYLVISGGTGCNSICAAFALSACYVLPVSDNGGSSSEIIRVLGWPLL